MLPITEKQHALLDYLRGCEECPSFDEMRDALRLKSKSGVHRLISALEERGFIRRLRGRTRAIEIIEDDGPRLVNAISHVSKEDLALEARKRGLVLGNIYRDATGARRFEAINA